MRRIITLPLLCALVSLGCSETTGNPRVAASPPDYREAMLKGENPQRPEVIALGIGDATIEVEVEVAGEGYGVALGLMHRTRMGQDEGMWFEFPEEKFRQFWMKDTKIPLSIAFVNSKGRIVNIEEMVPYDESSTRSTRKAKYAWEMNRGWFKKKKIEAGDLVRMGRVTKNPRFGKTD